MLLKLLIFISNTIYKKTVRFYPLKNVIESKY